MSTQEEQDQIQAAARAQAADTKAKLATNATNADPYAREYYTDPRTGKQVLRTDSGYAYAEPGNIVRNSFSDPQYDPETGTWYQVSSDGKVFPVAAPGTSANMLGGSAGASGQVASGLKAKGTATLGMYTGLADTFGDQQGGYATNATEQGDEAFAAGSAVAGRLGSLQDRSLAAYTGLPQSYDDAGIRFNWDNAIQQGSQFDPSGDSLDSARRLQTFNPGASAAEMRSSYDALHNYANQGPGPSAAQAQLQAALGQNIASQYSMANSGRNAGANAMAARNAGFTAADMSQKASAEMAALRATEEATWRNQKLSALAQSGQVAANIDASRVQNNQQVLSGLSSAANLYAGQDSLGLAARQFGASQYGAQYNAQAATREAATRDRLTAMGQLTAQQQQAYAQNQGLYAARANANAQAADITSRANGVTLSAYGAGTAADMGYNSSALDVYTGNANRNAASAGQDKSIGAGQAAASELRSERDTDRIIGAAGAGLAAGATALSGAQ